MTYDERNAASHQATRSYPEGGEFPGLIGRTADVSEPAWPVGPRPPDGAPNVIVIVLDDVGFSQIGCFGGLGNRIATPNLDMLAAGGLRYNNFHASPMCAPTRAALLTGRNNHAVGVGLIMESLSGYPGYDGRIPKDAAMLPAVLSSAGYSSCAIGKWHLTPSDEVTPIGPFDRWPLGQGFQRFYGFLNAATDQWQPNLWADNHRIEPHLPSGYHLSEDLVDQTLKWVAEQQAIAPHRPFFLYLSFGATHQPHQVGREWIEPYHSRFAEGWDVIREECIQTQKRLGLVPGETVLPPSNPGVRPWDALTRDERRLCERQMEVYAAFLTHTDHQIGRVVADLRKRRILENTFVLVMSDNGASAEGGPLGSSGIGITSGLEESFETKLAAVDIWGAPGTAPNYATGWAMAGNTPNRWYKRLTHEGGIRVPMIIHWPRGITYQGEIRHQFHHAVDVMPTILELTGIPMPSIVNGYTQLPLDGCSFAYTFNDAREPTRKQSQYFEMLGHRAMWAGGWKAVSIHHSRALLKFMDTTQDTHELLARCQDEPSHLDTDSWELYHLDSDFAESNDLAGQRPDIVRRLQQLWWHEAERNQVLPISGQPPANGRNPFGIAEIRDEYVYYGPVWLDGNYAPDLRNRSYRITAKVTTSFNETDGVLVAQGVPDGGFVLCICRGKVHYVINSAGMDTIVVSSQENLPEHVVLETQFIKTYQHGGVARVSVNDIPSQSAHVRYTNQHGHSLRGRDFRIGSDPVGIWDQYEPPFSFAGQIQEIIISFIEDER